MYPIGNTPAVNLLRDTPSSDGQKEVIRVLCLACGDPRSILFTLWSESGQGPCPFHVSDSKNDNDCLQTRNVDIT